jgi:hypothetical protein
MKAKAADAAPACAGFRIQIELLRVPLRCRNLEPRANACFQCGFKLDRRNDAAAEACRQRRNERRVGSGFGTTGASFGADGERQVSRPRRLWFRNGGHARIALRASLETRIIRSSTMEFSNFFANPPRIKPNAITCDLSRNVSQALDCETTVFD